MTTAREIMTDQVECIGENDTLVDAARKMRDLDVVALPICGEDNRLKGMVSDRDIIVRCIAEGGDPTSTRAGEMAQGKPVTIGADDSVEEALRTMAQHKVRRLPVIDGSRPSPADPSDWGTGQPPVPQRCAVHSARAGSAQEADQHFRDFVQRERRPIIPGSSGGTGHPVPGLARARAGAQSGRSAPRTSRVASSASLVLVLRLTVTRRAKASSAEQPWRAMMIPLA